MYNVNEYNSDQIHGCAVNVLDCHAGDWGLEFGVGYVARKRYSSA